MRISLVNSGVWAYLIYLMLPILSVDSECHSNYSGLGFHLFLYVCPIDSDIFMERSCSQIYRTTSPPPLIQLQCSYTDSMEKTSGNNYNICVLNYTLFTHNQ